MYMNFGEYSRVHSCLYAVLSAQSDEVWLGRCRDGSYAVNALRCDVWVVCTCIAVCIVACFIGFWEVFFGGSAVIRAN